MLNFKQCELARTMTKDNTPDVQINREFSDITHTIRVSIAEDIDKFLKLHNMPIDKGFEVMVDDFDKVSQKYSISPATLFCIYMDVKSKETE